MKIYDFTYVNKLNLTKTTLNDRVREFLLIECENQGWSPDFTFVQSSPPEKNKSHTEYQFEVQGRFLTSGEDVFESIFRRSLGF